jgi:hypothetical protein
VHLFWKPGKKGSNFAERKHLENVFKCQSILVLGNGKNFVNASKFGYNEPQNCVSEHWSLDRLGIDLGRKADRPPKEVFLHD